MSARPGLTPQTDRSADLEALFDVAKAASAKAYAPYSRFRVGAALRAASGALYAGCNVENIAYPLGTCAEAGVIAAARAAEGEKLVALEIAVYAATDADAPAACSPCGGCRQRILELGPAVKVHFHGPGLRLLCCEASELLPYAFTF